MHKKIRIYDLNIEYNVKYRRILYPRIEFKTGKLELILPTNYQNEEKLIDTHKDWIYKKHKEILTSLNRSKNKKLVNRSLENFKKLVLNITRDYLSELNLEINTIYFKKMNSKWASCSSNKNLMINTFLQYLPKKLIEYVIYHEITHLIERKHNKVFFELISRKFKDYKKKEEELFLYWFLIQNRIIK